MQDVLKNLKWEITERGARIIGCDEKFEGSMESPSRLDGVPVVEIGEGAFSGRHLLESVVIPDSVEVVGERAFAECDGLEELRLGAGIKAIEKHAFFGCNSLQSVVIPGSVEVVGERAFAECDGLEELRLGAGIKKIEEYAFNSCSSLKSVEIPARLKSSAKEPSSGATSSTNCG